jgi:hypothetical protein
VIKSSALYQRAESENGLSAIVAPTHARAPHALCHQRFAGSLHHPGADG